MKVICTRCGGTNIACEAIVNPNTGKIIDYLDESFMHANCGDCKEEVVITDVDRVKKDIDSMFFEFVKKNGKEPEKSANDWLGTKHELSWKSDKEKCEYVRELKHVFEVLLNHQALETLGTTNVIVDEICGEGTWAEYATRCQRWKDSQAKKEALIFEKRRKEKEDRKKKFEEQIEMWKSGKILELYLHYYLEDDQPNVWLRIKNGIIETSKNIKIERAEAERL